MVGGSSGWLEQKAAKVAKGRVVCRSSLRALRASVEMTEGSVGWLEQKAAKNDGAEVLSCFVRFVVDSGERWKGWELRC